MASLPQLVSVDLSHNMLATLDQLGALSSLNHLKEIVLFGNPLCEEEMYYEKVFALQPSLTFVDMRYVHYQSSFFAVLTMHIIRDVWQSSQT